MKTAFPLAVSEFSTLLKSMSLEQPKGKKMDHEQMRVYWTALDFVANVSVLVERLPRRHLYLIDQILRASSSVVLNIAEGAGEYSRKEKARFYRMARRSATECASVLDILRTLGLIREDEQKRNRRLLISIVSMLVVLIRR